MEILPWRLNMCSEENCYTMHWCSVRMYWKYSFLLWNNIFSGQSVVSQYVWYVKMKWKCTQWEEN